MTEYCTESMLLLLFMIDVFCIGYDFSKRVDPHSTAQTRAEAIAAGKIVCSPIQRFANRMEKRKRRFSQNMHSTNAIPSNVLAEMRRQVTFLFFI